MRVMRHGLLVVACAGALALPMTGRAQAGSGDPSEHWEAIARCGGIADDDLRLQCMDEVLRSAGIASGSRRMQAQAPARGPAVQTERSASRGMPQLAQPPADRTPSASQASTSAATRPGEPADSVPARMSTTIASVQTIGYQRLRITTAEGAVWEQTQAEAFRTPPKAGDAFLVEPASLGSFRCRFAEASRYRCKPAQ